MVGANEAQPTRLLFARYLHDLDVAGNALFDHNLVQLLERQLVKLEMAWAGWPICERGIESRRKTCSL
jgi:hypothetical protein